MKRYTKIDVEEINEYLWFQKTHTRLVLVVHGLPAVKHEM